jgi:peptide/nickel transport system ATP-binding protein
MRSIRGAEISVIFQDALAALNPVITVGAQILEALKVHQNGASESERKGRVIELLEIVGIPDPEERAGQYPHEYSGGMRQRAMIAMALANDPAVLIADEPTTALDVTIQAQVLDVFRRIQERTNTSVMLITHDLGVVAGTANRVMVMYAGRQAEIGSVDEIFYEPNHPYTAGLLASLPRLDRRSNTDSRLYRIEGQPPSLVFLPTGCAFHPRCPVADSGTCRSDRPSFRELTPSHFASCHFPSEAIKLLGQIQ